MQFIPGTHARVHPQRGLCWYCGTVSGVSQAVALRYRRWRARWMRGVGFALGLLLIVPTAWAGKQVGEEGAYIREVGFETAMFYVASGNGEGQVEYICRAFPGTTGSDSTAAAVWQVQKFTYDSSNRLSTIEFAGDDDGFNQICDNRVSLNYD